MADALAGTAALVTGSSSGIGAATARRLAAEGAAVALVARRRDRLEQLADSIRQAGGTAHVVQADVTEPQHAARAVRQAADRFGRLDIVVNNAGVMLLGPALQTTTGEWDRMVALKTDGSLWQWPLNKKTTAEAIEIPPTQLGIHHDWVGITSVWQGIISLAADGSLWFWPLEDVRNFGNNGTGVFDNFFDSGNSHFEPLLDISRKPQLLGNVFSKTD